MTYIINREKAAQARQTHEKHQHNYSVLFNIGLLIATLGLTASILSAVFEWGQAITTTGFAFLFAGAIIGMIATSVLKSDCMPARFLELEEEYKIIEIKHYKYLDDGAYHGYYRMTAVTEMENGNVAERFLGMARPQSNTKYDEITLAVNDAILYFPYPPKETAST